MARIEVTYFDVDGGRAEPIRIVLHAAGIAFEDNRISYADFAEVRNSTPLKQVPTVTIDGEQTTQSTALLRYFGKAAGLYPTDDYQALLCDEVMEGVEDLTDKLVASFGLEGDALKTAREAIMAGPLPLYLDWLNQKLATRGDYFADGRLTIADLKVFVLTGWLASGMLDHVPADCVQQLAPALAQHCERITADPAVQAYYQHRAGQH